MRIGPAIRTLRRYADMRQKELAARSGIRASYLSQIEKEQRQPALDVVGRIAAVLGLEASSLFYVAEVIDLAPGTPRPPFPDPKVQMMMDLRTSFREAMASV
jgi:transcriptional regulator with XRE-family HTH domain